MRRSLRLWWLALGVSLLVHLVLLGGLRWTLPQWEPPPEPVPFDANLVAVAPAVVEPPPPVRTPPVVKPPPPRQTPPARSAPKTEPVADAAVLEPAAKKIVPEPVAPTEGVPVARPVVEPTPPPPPAPVEAAPLPLNALPPRIELHFELRYGLASGEQTLLWVHEGRSRYTLVSVAEATGLTGLFYRGRFVQTSRGRITPRGLQPEDFWDQRGDKRSSAQFNPAQGLITFIPAKGAPRHFNYQGDVQDVVSLLFQVALTAPPSGRRVTYQVFNGKKLRDYTYEVLGETTLETELGALRTLHLARVGDGDGRFEVWLAIDRHYLPVRVLRSDENRSEMELSVKSIAP